MEELKARVVSGRQYNQIFQEDLRMNIIGNMQYDTKCLKQIEEQLEERESIINIINYIYKFTTDSNRSNKLLRKKERMEKNLCLEWPEFKN